MGPSPRAVAGPDRSLPLSGPFFCLRPCPWQAEPERRTLRGLQQGDLAPVQLHDALHDQQAESTVLATPRPERCRRKATSSRCRQPTIAS